MSRYLSYSDNTSGSDWTPKDTYNDDDIAKISDPGGGLNERPRTAIPSPFARVDLVKNAFRTLASDKRLKGPAMHRRLVSDALDVMQLMFGLPGYGADIRVVRWSPVTQIERMGATPEHHDLANTLSLFLHADAGAYNFSLDDDWFILLYGNQVVGSTSPATMAMGAPDARPVAGIMLEEGVPLFMERTRNLHERETDFIVWLVRYFCSFPELRRRMPVVYDYILANLEILRNERPDAYVEVTRHIPNPAAFTPELSAKGSLAMQTDYEEYSVSPGLRVLGIPVYCRRTDDALRHLTDSDFMLRPETEQPAATRLPLVLCEHFETPGVRPFRYINRPWNVLTEVRTGGLPPEERILPGTSVEYPWLGVADFLEPTLISLSTGIDDSHWLDPYQSRRRGVDGYLLPVKPLLFKYFPASFLASDVAPGKRALEMTETTDGIAVILRIPTRGGYVELKRTYRRLPAGTWMADDSSPEGNILPPAALSVSVFPFVRTGKEDIYNIQLLELCRDYKPRLDFYRGSDEVTQRRAPMQRTRFKVGSSTYYEIDSAIDAIRVTLGAPGGNDAASGLAIPVWPSYRPSSAQFVFAVDFGTTNTHVEYSVGNMPPKPLTFSESSEATLVATLAPKDSLAQFESIMELEFVPRSIDGFYGFPMRSALAENDDNDAYPEALRNINISFAYERKEFSRYRVHTNLKWASDPRLAEQFLRELAMLMRARVLTEGGDPRNTRIIYFYPVSMKRSLQSRYFSLWEDLFAKYFGGKPSNLVHCPESAAPAFHYSDASSLGADFVSVDIGGGTTDIVVYRGSDDGMSSQPVAIASLRYAGNTLFGDGFARADAAHNPLTHEYADYFSASVTAEPELAYLDVILNGILATGRSEDINAFLFAIENTPALRHLPALDRRRFSYNALLCDDTDRKIIFVYFYAGLIYYVATMLKRLGLPMPKQMYFSGTGSKISGIIGRHDTVQSFTRRIIERVFGYSYSDKGMRFTLRADLDAPKEVTCKGGVELLRRLDNGDANPDDFSTEGLRRFKTYFSPGAPEEGYTYRTIRSRSSREALARAARDFHVFLRDMLDRDTREELGIPQDSFDYFSRCADDDLDNYVSAAIDAWLPMEEGEDEVVEDAPFFYPLTGVIRNTLISGLTPENIRNSKTHK